MTKGAVKKLGDSTIQRLSIQHVAINIAVDIANPAAAISTTTLRMFYC